jgi:hypothetical protein
MRDRSIKAIVLAGWAVVAIGWTGAAMPAWADEPDASELAKKVQNPVADLISVPFQNNIDFGAGPDNDTTYVLNIQPVIPFHLTDSLNLITRTILPLVYAPSSLTGASDEFGLGDTQLSLFLSPAKSEGLIWGVGPIFQLPTTTDRPFGSEKWAAGPTGVVLMMRGPWVFGALANNLWSFAGDDDQPGVCQMLVQPFVNYNFEDGWYLVSAPIITADWKANSGDTWTVPIGGGGGRVFRVGRLPINAQLQSFYNAERPNGGSDVELRLQFQFLFPKS